MIQKIKKIINDNLSRLIIVFVIFVILVVLEKLNILTNELLKFFLMMIPYLLVGFNVLKKALKKLKHFDSFDESILMSIATIGAICLREYSEAVFVMFFYQVGELFEDWTKDKSRENIKSIFDLKPEFANIQNEKSEIIKIKPEEIKIGDIVIVKPYEKIPVDGEIIEGNTLLDTKMITGEPVPRVVTVGDSVLSGLINGDSIIKIRATKIANESTASKIVELIENSSNKKAKSENFITEFAKVYTPVVCIIALSIFILPTIVNIVLGNFEVWKIWLYRALTMLVISCPCSIVVSVPLAFFAGIGKAGKKGILIKGSTNIEKLSKAKIIALDKTGTMTKGVFMVVGLHHNTMPDDKLIEIAAHAEYYSNHPIAKSIIKYYNKNIDTNRIADVKEIGGHGISALVDNKLVLIGNEKLMIDNNIDYIKCNHVGTIVHVAIDSKYEGHIVISDVIKENSKKAIDELKNINVNNINMLTGDIKNVGEAVAKEIGINNVYCELLPNQKLEIVESLLSKKNDKEKLIFVGDGINDAPCITRSDIGMAMGALGSDCAIDVADVVLMNDDPLSIVEAIKISKKVMRIVLQNIYGSILIKVLFLSLSAIGISNMWLSIFADVGILVITILNSIRILR